MSEKEWYRHVIDGTIGYRVRYSGRDMIQLPSDGEEILRPYRKDEWVPNKTHIPKMSRAQVAMVTLAADRELCRFVGSYEDSRREWASMDHPERIAWMTSGPPENNEARRAMWEAITAALGRFTAE